MDTKQLMFSGNQNQQIENLIGELNPNQLSWLAGYLTGISQVSVKNDVNAITKQETAPSVENKPIQTPTEESITKPELTVLFGSRTGNGESVAKKLKSQGEAKGINVQLKDMNDYQASKLKDEKNLLVIVSTHGEGDPPIAAEDFYSYVHGKKAPKLEGVRYSVLAMGDKSYVHFCKVGKDIDEKLSGLGAERIHPRVDCDIDFFADADSWVQNVLTKFSVNGHSNGSTQVNGYTTKLDAQPQYNKQNPFKAKLLERIKLNGRGSEKETFHYELSLEGSGIDYKPGDSLGIYGVNSDKSVDELIASLHLSPSEKITVGDVTKELKEALIQDFEISALSPEVVSNYNKYAKNNILTDLLADPDKLKQYLYGRDVIDLFQEYPYELSPNDLAGVLRKLHPRLYSISSSLQAHPDEAHLTIAAVRYNNGRYKEGVCSTFLADRVGEDEFVRVYHEKNPEFKLPENTEAPIIMIGPGTGIAPFRAFLEERAATNSKGKNWLFYGDRNFATDFLYQTELLNYKKKGLLTKLSVAFSRDRIPKVYVQHKMLEHSRELYKWIEEGAYLYVCGDMQNMWRDVNKTLIEIVGKEGGLSVDKAEEYVQLLRKQRRYLTDVY